MFCWFGSTLVCIDCRLKHIVNGLFSSINSNNKNKRTDSTRVCSIKTIKPENISVSLKSVFECFLSLRLLSNCHHTLNFFVLDVEYNLSNLANSSMWSVSVIVLYGITRAEKKMISRLDAIYN